jgi:MraZ protein
VEIVDFFHGGILNAVDAKGRVSLPSTFRNAIDRRARRAALPGEQIEDRIVMVGEHEEFPCLAAFDQTYSRKLYENIERRVAASGASDEMKALDHEQMEAFGAMNEVSYDGSGRMVLSPLLRSIAASPTPPISSARAAPSRSGARSGSARCRPTSRA